VDALDGARRPALARDPLAPGEQTFRRERRGRGDGRASWIGLV